MKEWMVLAIIFVIVGLAIFLMLWFWDIDYSGDYSLTFAEWFKTNVIEYIKLLKDIRLW